jgi:hypothetical protein
VEARPSGLLSGLVSGSVAWSSDLLSGLEGVVCWSGHPTLLSGRYAAVFWAVVSSASSQVLFNYCWPSQAGSFCFAGGPACWRSCLVYFLLMIAITFSIDGLLSGLPPCAEIAKPSVTP